MEFRRPRSFAQVILGRPLETSEAPHQAIGKVAALAVFASDALSSVAYATEEILVILALAGTAALHFSIPIALAIALLLIIVTISYRQTIFAYPSGGGAYSVSRENLGNLAAQVAAAALMVDYILTVAVSMSAGVAQMVSAFPALGPFRTGLAAGLILLMSLLNLRGTRESSAIFAVPTYFFILMAGGMILVGVLRWARGSLGEVGSVDAVGSALQPITLFLLLRAFSSGSTALTGVEAISNGISAFKPPRSKNAATTLTVMAGILLFLFLGITLLANQVHAFPNPEETIVSQIARTVFGSGALYLLTIAATTGILILAANTSFADFPRLAALVAADGYLPRQLTLRGSRLVFSWGITGLTLIASLLVLVFRASVTGLIPLYAVGVFLSFTLSQSGMVVHWQRVSRGQDEQADTAADVEAGSPRRVRARQAISAMGALATGFVTLVFAVTKFRQGAWLIVILIPALTWGFSRIRRHYQLVAKELSLATAGRTANPRQVISLILVDRLHASTLRTISFANSLGHPWRALHVSVDPQRTAELQRKWKRQFGEIPLEVLPSPYRSLTEPVLDYVRHIRKQSPQAFIHVLYGELVTESYWEQALHENSAVVLEFALRQLDGVGITHIPFHLHHMRAGDLDQGRAASRSQPQPDSRVPNLEGD